MAVIKSVQITNVWEEVEKKGPSYIIESDAN